MCMANTCKVYTFYGCPSFHCNFTVYICNGGLENCSKYIQAISEQSVKSNLALVRI